MKNSFKVVLFLLFGYTLTVSAFKVISNAPHYTTGEMISLTCDDTAWNEKTIIIFTSKNETDIVTLFDSSKKDPKAFSFIEKTENNTKIVLKHQEDGWKDLNCKIGDKESNVSTTIPFYTVKFTHSDKYSIEKVNDLTCEGSVKPDLKFEIQFLLDNKIIATIQDEKVINGTVKDITVGFDKSKKNSITIKPGKNVVGTYSCKYIIMNGETKDNIPAKEEWKTSDASSVMAKAVLMIFAMIFAKFFI